ncbi:tyrosine-type recombinase/integrase [Brachybacterium paraconglomeratum]|uniref:tyrosine-type recombinase/integrase n=1 Tax=Micrococcales TaxID=85006 RepID=UPI0008A4A0D5|nr:tyrosine-type recombinase/integrase [Brachybacterium sp. HMSC06H03]OFT57362.1 hypothetical protein HMPREF3159_08780 [Brachybacterium sp. HMSC06H03]
MSELFVDAARDWIAERRAVGRTISAETAKAYRADLASWQRYLGAQTGTPVTVQDLSGPVIKAALAEMNNAGLAPATRRRLLTTLRGLCRYLVLESRLPGDPTAAIQAPRAPGRLPVAFTDGQISDLLETARAEDPQARPAAPLLDVAIVVILAAGGLRASEAADLRLLDYRPGEEPSLRVIGKGRKARTVPLDQGVAEQIDTYLPWRAMHAVDEGDSSPLLVRPDGRALTRDTISYRVNRLYARAGIVKPEGEAAHALRHTYAVSMVDVGVPVSEIQQLLGHESIGTTGIYLKASASHLRAASSAPSAARLLASKPGQQHATEV